MSRADYTRWYWTAAWRRRSKALLKAEPLCRDCMSRGIIKPADHADHVIPHQGDWELFWSGDIQPLCESCHSVKTAREQGKSTVRSVALDGSPDGWE